MADADTGVLAEPQFDSSGGLEQLVECDGDRLYRLALHITGVEQDASDVIEDTLRAAVDAVDSFACQSALESWIYRTVARAAHERRRRRQPVGATVPDDVVPRLAADGHFEPMIDWSTRIHQPEQHDELARAVATAIDELPVDYRTALILHDVDCASKAAIADILTIEVTAVSSRVHRARLFVRHRLSEHFAHETFTS